MLTALPTVTVKKETHDAPEVGDYARWPIDHGWEWVFANGTKARMRERLWTLAQVMNMLIDAGFEIERVVEQAFEDMKARGAAGRLPYVHRVDTVQRST